MSVCPVSSLVLCMSRFVKARSSRWNRGTLGPNLSKPPLPCGKRVCIEEGPHVEILNLPEHRESIQNRSLGTFDTKGLLGISWTYSGIALQVTWQWHGSCTDSKCKFNSSHRSETASFLFICHLPQIGVFQNVMASRGC